MWNPFLESTLIKSYSIQNLLRCHCGQTSLCEVAANLTSSDTMIVFEVGVGLACGATRRCSWGVEFAAASRDTHRFSAQGRVLSTVPSGRRYASLAAGTCHRFPDPEKQWLAPRTLLLWSNLRRQRPPSWQGPAAGRSPLGFWCQQSHLPCLPCQNL